MDQNIDDEIRRNRRRERWAAFLRPILTLASVVISIGLLMYFMKACQGRFPESPLLKQRPQSAIGNSHANASAPVKAALA